MSLASASSLPTPVARPRIEAIDATGARLRRTSMSGSACSPVGPSRDARGLLQRREKIVMRQEEALDRTVEHDDLHLLIGLERRDDLVRAAECVSGPKMFSGG